MTYEEKLEEYSNGYQGLAMPKPEGHEMPIEEYEYNGPLPYNEVPPTYVRTERCAWEEGCSLCNWYPPAKDEEEKDNE
jgi:hypothetical protein